jgi:hypothetical protein
MKTWIFVIGIVSSSLLFFVSGTLVGYSVCHRQAKAGDSSKPHRKPLPNPTNIIGKIVDRQAMSLTSRIRTPTPTAVEQAESYEQYYLE